MEMSGSRTVPANIDATWRALNDPEVLKACIAGCESIERVSENELKVAMTARVGPVSARFQGRIVITDVVPPTAYTLGFEGQGGAAGFAKGEARVTLSDNAPGTRIDYQAKAQVGGKLAQTGSRLVDGAAAKVADDFFARFVERLGSPEGEAVTAETDPASPPVERSNSAVTATSTDDKNPITLRSLWAKAVFAVVIVAAIVYYWLARRA